MSTFQWYSFTGKFLQEITVGLAVNIVTEGGSESPDINSSGKHSPSPFLPPFLPLSFSTRTSYDRKASWNKLQG